MISEDYLREKKIEELKKIADVSEDNLAKMSYKEKQAVFRAKAKICKVFFRGGTYTKRRAVK